MKAPIRFAVLLALAGLWGHGPALRAGLAGPVAAEEGSVFSAMIEGRPWAAVRGDGMMTTMAGRPALVITGVLAGEGRTPSMFGFILIPENGKFEGRYDLTIPGTAPTSSGRFTANMRTRNEPEDHYVFATGEVVIETFDAANETVSGRFSGTLENRAGSRSLDVSDGRFANVRFRKAS